jgi:hypothetical protein
MRSGEELDDDARDIGEVLRVDDGRMRPGDLDERRATVALRWFDDDDVGGRLPCC